MGNNSKPYLTLFLLSSIDGKINFAEDFSRDYDKDIPKMKYASKGLYHYYDAEKTTDEWSINSGKVMAKMFRQKIKSKDEIYIDGDITSSIDVNFVVYDNHHLNKFMILWLCKRAWPSKLVIFTKNKQHDAIKIMNSKDSRDDNTWENFSNLQCYHYFEIANSLSILKKIGCNKATLQTGETMNSVFFKEGFIDALDLVIAPFVVGKNATNIAGPFEIPREFKLKAAKNLGDSYLRLQYERI